MSPAETVARSPLHALDAKLEAVEESPRSPKWARDLEIVSIDMGYGHLRPAYAIAEYLGREQILLADQAPLAQEEEQRLWQQARKGYEMLSRASKVPALGGLMGDLLDGITNIPSLYPKRDLTSPTVAVRLLAALGKRGMGAGLSRRLDGEKKALLSTFYAPALLADQQGCAKTFCVVTDSDVNRVWVAPRPETSGIVYFAPTQRVKRRLKAYGVHGSQIDVTGYPLPDELVGGTSLSHLRENLRHRLARLDPRGRLLRECRKEVEYFLGEIDESSQEPPHLVFAVGGAGAQAEMAELFLPALAGKLKKGQLRLTLVAGIRPEVAQVFRQALLKAGLLSLLDEGAVSILLEENHERYFQSFNQMLKSTDILWTKPSELTFFGALGLPIVFSRPVGSHERYNRRWAMNSGSGMKGHDPRHAGDWIWELLRDGTFAAAAWTGYMTMPKFGLYRIVEALDAQLQ